MKENKNSKKFYCNKCGYKIGTQELGVITIIPAEPVGLEIQIISGQIVCPGCNSNLHIIHYGR